MKNLKNVNKSKILLISSIIIVLLLVFWFFYSTKNILNTKNITSNNTLNSEKELSGSDLIPNVLNTFSDICESERPNLAKKFIDNNISKISQLDGDIIVTMYIDQLRRYKEMYSKDIYTWEYQIALLDAYDKSYNLTKINKNYSSEINEYLNSMKTDGFLLNYSEGIVDIFPNYGALKEYSDYLSDSVKEYIDIISRESSEILSTDKEIIITWDELSYRVLNTENYVLEYPDSIKYDEVYDLYLLYMSTFLLGFQDTPIYYWNTKMIRNDVLQIYNKTIIHNKNTYTANIINEYMDIIRENENRVTGNAINYANKIIKELAESRSLELSKE